MSDDDNPNTARTLGQFRSELIEEGFSAEIAEQLALDWGRALAHTGTTLKAGG